MKAGWQVLRLGDVCEFDKSQGVHAGLPYVGLEDIESQTARFIGSVEPQVVKSSTFKFSTQHVLYGRLRPYLNKVLAPEFAGHCSTEIFPIKPSPVLSREYLLYWFLSDDTVERINATCTGARMPRADMNEVLDFDFPIPPLPEQQRIVTLLDEAFDGIAKAKVNAEKNLLNAREIFDCYLSKALANGEGHHEMVRLDSLTRLSRGHNPPKSKFSNEAKPGYVRFYQIRDGSTDAYTVYVPDTPQLHKMEKDDIMMVAYRHVGRAFRGVEGAFNVALCKISNLRRDLLDDDYLFHLIPSEFVKGELLKRSERSLIPSMSIEHLKEIKIPLPALQEQQRIVNIVKNLTISIQRLEVIYQKKLTSIDGLKKSLLHRAFNGDL